ncbi:oxygen-dependent protoporphyrinogen oxidase [Pseudocyphellaria aurata]|nr:oxygen-dependent protoporphyrinogen oxidase [Pseudocyphellaria aurata]
MNKTFSPSSFNVTAFSVLFKQCYVSPSYHKPYCRQHFATQTSTAVINDDVKDVAILGGGITGLACAYYLSRDLPNIKITLLEGTSRLGGWLKTETINVGDGSITFEQGPRSLRTAFPNGPVTLDLVSKLGLERRLLATDKKSIAAQSRYIYYPGRLVRLPGPGQSLLKNISSFALEPVFKGTLSACFSEPFKPPRDERLKDESIASFISRRFGSPLANNLASAFVHGVYAGNIDQLSVRSIFPKLWMFEGSDRSVLKGLLKARFSGTVLMPAQDIKLLKNPPDMKGWGTFTFVGGIGELADTLVKELEKNPNVMIQKQTNVQSLELQRTTSDIQINVTRTGPRTPTIQQNFSHVISTISGVNLDKIADLPPLRHTPAVTVMVVNLFFARHDLLPVHGFGYLVPRSVPFSENAEHALGVVFDSEATHGQDTVPGTKVTVMLGGHWWDDWPTYPDEEEGAKMAKAILKRHLGIVMEPTVIRVGLQKDCIPQYTVGHFERMVQTSSLLKRFEGRLRVAGSSYKGVGLNDCVRAASDVVRGLVDGTGTDGLESFVSEPQWVWLKTSPN